MRNNTGTVIRVGQHDGLELDLPAAAVQLGPLAPAPVNTGVFNSPFVAPCSAHASVGHPRPARRLEGPIEVNGSSDHLVLNGTVSYIDVTVRP
ncbi:MAG: hypothetical protein U0835_10170 [Isosphaeraceae bacterium]